MIRDSTLQVVLVVTCLPCLFLAVPVMAQPDTLWTRLLSPAAFNYNMEFIHTRDGGFAFCGAISPQIEGRRTGAMRGFPMDGIKRTMPKVCANWQMAGMSLLAMAAGARLV